MKCNLFPFFCYSLWGGGGGGGWYFGSGSGFKFNCAARVGSGRVGSDDLGYGPGSGFSFEPLQTSSLFIMYYTKRIVLELEKAFQTCMTFFSSVEHKRKHLVECSHCSFPNTIKHALYVISLVF